MAHISFSYHRWTCCFHSFVWFLEQQVISQLGYNLQKGTAITFSFTVLVLSLTMVGIELELSTFLMDEWMAKIERITKGGTTTWIWVVRKVNKWDEKEYNICLVCDRHCAEHCSFFALISTRFWYYEILFLFVWGGSTSWSLQKS